MITESDKETIVNVIVSQINPWLIVLFGSQAKNMAMVDSDVDIAFFSDEDKSDYDRFMLAQGLVQKLNKEVDLLNLAGASTVLQAQVLTGGVVLYCRDENRRQAYYIKVLKEYALLNEERASVLAAIERPGMCLCKS